MKKVGADDCWGPCSVLQTPPCPSPNCYCMPLLLVAGYCSHASSPTVVKIVEEHPNLCQSHADCMKKGSGSFCASYPNPDIKYGWCFASNFEAQKVFFKIFSDYEFIKGFTKMRAIA